MAVAVEVAHERSTIRAAAIDGADVGIEAGIHVVLALGIEDLLAEGVPVGRRSDGEVVGGQFLPQVYGRGAAIDIHLYFKIHARARKVNNLIPLLSFSCAEFHLLGLYHLAGTVGRCDAQHHLGAVVPHGVRLVGIVPRHAHRVCPFVLPTGRVVADAQQVDVRNGARGLLGTVVAVPSPVLGNHAAHAVGQPVEGAVARKLSVGNGINESAVNVGVAELVAIKHEGLRADCHEVGLLARQRALHLEEVGAGQIVGVGIHDVPRQLYR